MLPITSLSVKNFRTHADYEIDFISPSTIITGPNGSGKTSLIEAIYIALQGKSFKATDSEIIQYEKPWYRIDVNFNGTHRTVKYDPNRPSGKKQFIIDDRTFYRLPHAQQYPIVLFEPDDLRLLNGSPQRRRDFLDQLIRQIDGKYDQSIRHYERALKQRNNLLKQPYTSSDNLFVWDVLLGRYGAEIITARKHYIEILNQLLTNKYRKISHNTDIVEIDYGNHQTISTEQQILSLLHKNHERDILLGYTSYGPHRDDFTIMLNNSQALHRASRGETRTIILSLKSCEADLIYETTNNKPIVLLDDVFSELDEVRQENLANIPLEQLIITSTTVQHTPANQVVIKL